MKRLGFVLSVLVCLSGCIPTGQKDIAPAELRTFWSEAELTRYFGIEYLGTFHLFDALFGYVATPSQDDRFLGKVSVRSPSDNTMLQDPFSGHVDQTDLVQTDSTYLYVARGTELHIVRAAPADQVEAVGFLNLDWWGDAIYLHGQTAIVVGGWVYSLDDRGPLPIGEGVGPDDFRLQIVDISDPSQPTARENLWFRGELLGSQKIGSKLVLLMASFPWPSMTEVTRHSIQQYMTGPDFEPRWARGQGYPPYTERSLVSWDRILHPANPTGWQVVSIITVNLDHLDQDPQAVSVMGNFNDVYMTPSVVYLTNSPSYEHPRTDTEVYKFDLIDGVAQYVAAGRFDGHVYGYRLLDEMGGDLRVVTTTEYDPSGPSIDDKAVNHVAVLQQKGQRLETVGRTEDFRGPGVPNWTHFLGNLAFVDKGHMGQNYTTFDLADPLQPRIVSDWLPGRVVAGVARLDTNHLLAIGGQSYTAEDPSDGGTYLLLYDISDPANPFQVAEQLVGEVGSNLTRDSVSFVDGRLVLPIDLYKPWVEPYNHTQVKWTGLYAYDISANGFTELGRVEMAGTYYNTEWMRGLFIGDEFYGVSNSVVKVAPADDLTNVTTTVELP